MSAVHIHIGQCGNQLGKEFWLKVSAAAEKDPNIKRAFVTPSGPGRDEFGHLRAIFIDSEKKVLQSIKRLGRRKKKTTPDLKIGDCHVLSAAKGCGSNWSMGHNYLAKESVMREWSTNLHTYSHELEYGAEDSMLKASMEVIRREVEQCDCFSGFILWHSLAGGTGSGFGSRLSAELRDRYPVAHQMNITVSPHASGETPMQPYNELLCLANLQQDSDAIVMFSNDEIMNLVSRQSTSISIEDMNSYITDCMFNILRPVTSLTPPNGVTVGIEPWELIRSVSPMHTLKLLNCRTLMEGSGPRPTSAKQESWDNLCNKLCHQARSRQLQINSDFGFNDSSLATAAVCRNVVRTQRSEAMDIAKLATKIKTAYHCVKWNPFPVDVWTDEVKQGPKSITVCSNMASLGTIHCANLIKSARLKYSARAYLHWYERYGTEDCDFENAFEVVQDIVNEYEKAAAP